MPNELRRIVGDPGETDDLTQIQALNPTNRPLPLFDFFEVFPNSTNRIGFLLTLFSTLRMTSTQEVCPQCSASVLIDA
jgi:hypothetical protein